MGENNEDKGFSVKDKRFFTEEGEAHPDAAVEEKIKPDDKTEPGAQAATEKQTMRAEEQEPPFPEINFPGFLLSLHTSAMFHFGDLADPATGETARNIPAAKQTIDLLAMLQEKTRGNLEKDEEMLIEGILYELRMRYIKEKEKK
jgi:hypothetical protein